MLKIWPTFFVLLLVCSATCKLIYTAGIIRHGASYPSGELYDAKEFKDLQGLLTPIGMRQLYLLGTYLKQEYSVEEGLVHGKSDPKEVEIFSTSYQRVYLSALSFLYGLFPTGEGWTIPAEVTSDKLNPPFEQLEMDTKDEDGVNETDNVKSLPFALAEGFQALPVFYNDNIFDNCPEYGVLLTNRYKEIAQTVAQFEALQSAEIAKMKLIFNLTILQSTIATMSNLYQTLISDINLGRKLPKEFTDYDLKNLRFIANYYDTLIFAGNFGRVLATPTLRMIRNNLSTASARKNAKKMTLNFGHRSNLLPLMTSLNLTTAECVSQQWKNESIASLNCMVGPEYGANLLV